ncbi:MULTISPECIES: hypothetical protein [unclassified Stenotrophomonas]|jgi:hypothetical protein|nr:MULTISPECIES: hypothetical protein [unclassified Stenotrophomonas]
MAWLVSGQGADATRAVVDVGAESTLKPLMLQGFNGPEGDAIA